jgi:hypothetical protein
MFGSRPAGDAGVVQRLRGAGAVLLDTASLSEWCNFCGPGIPAGWSPRGGQGKVRSLSRLIYWFLGVRERNRIQVENLYPYASVSTGLGPMESTTTRIWA